LNAVALVVWRRRAVSEKRAFGQPPSSRFAQLATRTNAALKSRCSSLARAPQHTVSRLIRWRRHDRVEAAAAAANVARDDSLVRVSAAADGSPSIEVRSPAAASPAQPSREEAEAAFQQHADFPSPVPARPRAVSSRPRWSARDVSSRRASLAATRSSTRPASSGRHNSPRNDAARCLRPEAARHS
jgi:hypothetical protein